MKPLTEYIQKKHIKSDKELIQLRMNDYKKIPYKTIVDLTDETSGTVWKQALSAIKEMCHIDKFTKEAIKKFLHTYYTLFLNINFDDNRINDKRSHLTPNFLSLENILEKFEKNFNGLEHKCDNFTYWATPCMFNAFIILIHKINKGYENN